MTQGAGDQLPPTSADDLGSIRRIDAFAPLSDDLLADILRDAAKVDFAPGEALIRQGEQRDVAFIILDGDVEVINETALGDSQLATLAAPLLVGEIAALAQTPRTATVRAATAVRALSLDRTLILEVCQGNPGRLVSIVRQLARQMHAVTDALGVYASGFAALERDDFDPAMLDSLNNPTPEMRGFQNAFRRLSRHIVYERRQRREMASAAMIQRAMLPGDLRGLDLRGRFDAFGDIAPAREVGGDLYDAFALDADRVALVIGDVCGKGVPASLFMSITLTVLRLAAREGGDVGATLQRANAMLFAQNPSGLYATLIFGVLDLRTGRFEYGVCGHNPAFRLLRAGGCETLEGGGTPLGFFPDKTVRTAAVDLEAGDQLFLFTDGVTECVNSSGEDFGEARLALTLSTLAGQDAETVCRTVMDAVGTFTDGVEPFDDVTCLAVRWRGEKVTPGE